LMNAIQLLASEIWVQSLGWALVHFLWQGVAIAAAYAVARWMLRSESPNVRYLLGCGALAALMAAPLVTLSLKPLSGNSVAGHAQTAPAQTFDTTIAGVSQRQARITASNESFGRILPWVVFVWLAGAVLFWIRLMGSWIVAAGMRTTR